MSVTTKIYRGILTQQRDIEDDDDDYENFTYNEDYDYDFGPGPVEIVDEDGESRSLPEAVTADLPEQGSYVVVRFWICDGEVSSEVLLDAAATTVMGLCDTLSERWRLTPEIINVSGIRLLDRLEEFIGKFLHMEIDYYNGEEPARPRSLPPSKGVPLCGQK